ncbi:sucrase ferredoxin, partial [Streptomyces sp. SB3404]|nr:sucrase ferredoxin [Streptomyces boncukensis]
AHVTGGAGEAVTARWSVTVAHLDGRRWRVTVTAVDDALPVPASCGAALGAPARMRVDAVQST